MNKTFFSSTTVISGNANGVTMRSPLLKQKCQLTLISDYHCGIDDERGEPFVQYSARMERCSSRKDMLELEQAFAKACENGSDAIILTGDMISFPSEKGVETLAALMEDSPIPVYYIAGNHDWHYEGLQGSDIQQRQEWIEKRLLPLYAGRDPMNYAVEIKGIKLIMLDNSVYHILPSQLQFLRNELAGGKPVLLGCHIPFYTGLPSSVAGFGCGHPDWGAATDPYYEIERRERWAETGLSAETFAFRDELFHAENVLGIVAGHTHINSLTTLENKFQFVVSSRQSAELILCGSEQ